jgi:hypothetical protein
VNPTREKDKTTLGQMLADAQQEHSRVMIICGLLGHHAAEHAKREDMHVLRCMGVESEIELAFVSQHQLVGPLIDRIDNLPPSRAIVLRGAVGLGGGPQATSSWSRPAS